MIRIVERWLLLGALAASGALNLHFVAGGPKRVEDPIPEMVVQVPDGRPCCALVDTLALSETQKRQLSKCCPKMVLRKTRLGEQINVLVAQLNQELCTEDPCTTRIYALADEIGKVSAEQLKSRTDSVLLVKQTLTPDQLEKLTRLSSPSK